MRLRYWILAIAVAGLTAGSLWADEEKKPDKKPGRGPEVMFDRLDKNDDGALTADEAPERGKERFERLLHPPPEFARLRSLLPLPCRLGPPHSCPALRLVHSRSTTNVGQSVSGGDQIVAAM